MKKKVGHTEMFCELETDNAEGITMPLPVSVASVGL